MSSLDGMQMLAGAERDCSASAKPIGSGEIQSMRDQPANNRDAGRASPLHDAPPSVDASPRSIQSSVWKLPHYLSEIRTYPMLTPEEECSFALRWRQHGDIEAAHKLVTSHLRLVAKIAGGYRGYGLPLNDLIAEGNLGLVRAVKTFDPERGARLATYATWWIRAAIQRHVVDSCSLVKMGTTAAQKKLFFNLRRLKGRMQVIEEGDLSPDMVKQIAGHLGVPEADVVDMNRRLAGHDYSLNAPFGADGEGERQDRFADDADDQEITLADREELSKRRKLLIEAMDSLSARERHIVAQRWLRENQATFEELGRYYNISRERVRQIETRAVQKLRRAVAHRTRMRPAGIAPGRLPSPPYIGVPQLCVDALTR